MAIGHIKQIVPATFSPILIYALTAFLLPPYFIYLELFKYFDLGYRICLAELNRRKNIQRFAEQEYEAAPKTMACVVGYREEPRVYKESLLSLRRCQTGCIVAAIDGNDEEDTSMVETFKTVFTDPSETVLHLELSLGKRFVRHLEYNSGGRAESTDHGTEYIDGYTNGYTKGTVDGMKSEPHTEAETFKQAYNYAKQQLESAGVLQRNEPPRAICFTQPHCDLKEIRFSAWIVSFVLADRYGLEYLWSSDSDTCVEPDTLDKLARVIRAEPRAAGGGVYVRLQNADASMFAKMASLAWALDMYMNRAALGAFGTSECLNGPSSMHRVSALRDVAVPQYRFHYFKHHIAGYKNTVLNEDIQTTMLLAKRGWQRLYIENTYAQTGGPETLRQWLGQRLRWSRGINLHRVFDAWYITSQGPLTAWYWLRSGFYDVFIFLWVSCYAITGRHLFPVSLADVLVFEILPPLYNLARCSAPLPDPVTTVLLFALYRLVCPSYRMYTLLTPFGVGWGLPTTEKGKKWDLVRFVRREHEGLFFCLWIAIASGALVRWVFGLGFIALSVEPVVVLAMSGAYAMTAVAMFAF